MSKEGFMEALKKEGFPADIKDGIVYVDKALTPEEVGRFHEILMREKYCESYGFRRVPESMEGLGEKGQKKSSRRKAREKHGQARRAV